MTDKAIHILLFWNGMIWGSFLTYIAQRFRKNKKNLIEFDEEKRMIRYQGKTFVAYDIEQERGNLFASEFAQSDRWHLTIRAKEKERFIRDMTAQKQSTQGDDAFPFDGGEGENEDKILCDKK